MPDHNYSYLPFAVPWFGSAEKEEILATLESDWITTGPRAQQFEREFAAYTGSAYALAVNSCTAALHLALAALNVGAGDAVITTPFTFTATANVIVHQRAYPVFIDIDPDTYNLDPAKLSDFLKRRCSWRRRERALCLKQNGRRVRAIIPVHYGGHPCDMDAITALGAQYDLAVIEDAAHAAGATYGGRRAGSLGTAACFSFYANKNMTTAEGGMLTTSDLDLYERGRVLSLHGISKDAWKRYSKEGSWRYDVVCAGFKYNMPDTAAALGLHQLKKLDGFIARRAELAARYTKAFSRVAGLKLPSVKAGIKSAWHLYPVQITSASVSRDQVIEHLRQRNIGSSVHFIPLHLTSFYQREFGYRPGDFPVAEQVFERIVSLPFFPRMRNEDVDRVAAEVSSLVAPMTLAQAS
ncbi:MAG: DegT/DnrJ/EryC1/StrS family aminotransferase [Terriglobales bacterium]